MSENVRDIYEYKKSKKIVKDVDDILPLLNEMSEKLNKWDVYTPIHDILLEIRTAKTLLQIHYNQHKRVVNNGKI